ncbi:hypothetical protein NDU88_006672 [Pleurodeles waltl]|uniref:Uncharacterized protein n=1 Tax=Pleurodeles waltl TaxID=8319 RepID=A0AAV7ME37_PLEWA|nr:hypothetical protein NDU88_006672 [Pleurodeles waltl]
MRTRSELKLDGMEQEAQMAHQGRVRQAILNQGREYKPTHVEEVIVGRLRTTRKGRRRMEEKKEEAQKWS